MTHQIPIAVGAGLVSAIVFISVALGQTGLGVILSAIMPLPILLAGLAFGWQSALIAGLTATFLILLTAGTTGAAAFAATQAAPATGLTYLALLSRSSAAGDGTDTESVEWYPVGRLVIAAAVMGAALAFGLCLALGGTQEALVDTAKGFVESLAATITTANPDAKPMTDADKTQLTQTLASLMPVSLAVTFMILILFNLWLAGRVTRASGQLSRPWPDLHALAYPRGTALAFAGATAAGYLDGLAGMAAAALSGSLLFAYLLLGLTIIHALTRGAGWRPIALGALYAAMLVNPLAAPINPVPLLVAALGLADGIWPLRGKRDEG